MQTSRIDCRSLRASADLASVSISCIPSEGVMPAWNSMAAWLQKEAISSFDKGFRSFMFFMNPFR